MSLIDVHSAATAGIVDALIAAEAMRTAILLMIELHRASWYEESYSCASLSSIARESFRVRLWLRQINFGLERTTAMTSSRSTTACACRKSNPNILVVQPAQDRAAKNGPGQFDGARDRRILLQR